eukprot:938811-Prymnesium_polylepis.1
MHRDGLNAVLHCSLGALDAHAFYFSYGCVVTWGLSERAELEMIRELKKASGPPKCCTWRSLAYGMCDDPRAKHGERPSVMVHPLRLCYGGDVSTRRPLPADTLCAGGARDPPSHTPPLLTHTPCAQAGHATSPLDDNEVDDFSYLMVLGARPSLQKDTITLSPEEIKEKLAISFALAQ